MKFNKSTCWVLHLERGNTGYTYMEDETLKSSPMERDVEVLIDSKLNINQQCALAVRRATQALGCTRPSMPQGEERSYSALICAEWSHLQHWLQVRMPQHENDIRLSESPNEGYEDGEDSGGQSRWGLAEVPWSVQLRAEEAGGSLRGGCSSS